MKYVLILAGGSGTRMGNTDLPKQFLDLGSKPIIIHTIEQFLINARVDKILVLCSKEWITYMNDLLKKFNICSDKIIITNGGSTRNDTVINGCNYIVDNYGLNDKDIIITHDAVRPFVSQRIIDDNIDALNDYDAVDTVVPSTDTIVESIDGETISNIPNRKYMYQGQTPQSFNLKKFIEVYGKLADEEKGILTDACKIFRIKNELVKIVAGDLYNMKITTQFDLKMSNAILMERGSK